MKKVIISLPCTSETHVSQKIFFHELCAQGPKKNENVSINGKNVNAVVGQKVSVVAAQARVKISYNCKAGDCGTCNIKMNGRTVKACQQVIPAGKCNIQT